MSKSVISKGKFALPKVSNFISLIQFLFIKEDGCKFLLLKLSNDRDETVNRVTLEITQKDIKGQPLNKYKMDFTVTNGKPHTKFALDKMIAIENDCVDFSVEVISADFGKYKYVAVGDTLILNYQNHSSQGANNAVSPPLKRTGVEYCVTARNFKVPIIICLAMIMALALSIVFTYFHLQNFMSSSETFFESGIEYGFENSDKSLDSKIFVVGCKDNLKDVVIPEKIKGHEVAGISDGAFIFKPYIEKITIKAPIKIYGNTFQNLPALAVVNLEKATEVGNSAFFNCINLSEITALNLSKIGDSAFSNCINLKTVKIINDKSVLQIGKNAFSNCLSLKNVIIDQYIDYSENTQFFSNSFNVSTLQLKNFNHNFSFGAKVYIDKIDKTISELFGADYLSGSILTRIRELTIENCDAIAENFCYNIPLTSMSIKNLLLPVIGDMAFKGCINLKKFDVPTDFTRVGDFAFYRTEITEFNGINLSYIGDSAFEFCQKLNSFSLEKNDSLLFIGERAFSKCYSLKNFTVPSTITEIKDRVFESCLSLTSLTLPDNIIKIGSLSFNDCKQLKSFDVPESVISIGFGAFQDCTSLKEISLPFIGGQQISNDFFGYVFGADFPFINKVPNSLEKVTIINETEIAENAFFNCSFIKEINIGGNFTKIGDNAFYSCKRLNLFVIPSSVTAIGTNSFSNCYKLFEVYNLSSLPVSESSKDYGWVGYYALRVYDSLADIKIDKMNLDGFEFGRSHLGKWYLLNYTGSQTSLSFPQYPFYNGILIDSYKIVKYMMSENYAVTSITIPEKASAIGEYAFSACTSLTSVSLTLGVQSIGFGAFENCIALSQMTLPFIGNTADSNRFMSYIFGLDDYNNINATNIPLKTVTILNMMEVPDFAFYGFAKLTSVNFPTYYIRIGESAFYNCRALENFKLSEYLLSIDANAFYNCESLTSVTIPESVKSVGLGAYESCNSLREITIPFVGESNDKNRFFGFIFGAKTLQDNGYIPYSLKTVTLTKSVEILENAFAFCNIEKILLPIELKNIGKNAFFNCNNLKQIDIPENVTTIGESAFYNCGELGKVTLSGIIDIQQDAFYNCLLLYEVYNLGDMKIIQGSKASGYIAFYALAVYTSPQDEPLEEIIINDMVFVRWKNQWSIIRYNGYQSELNLSSFEYKGNTISSYSIKHRAFMNNEFLVNLTIGKEVTSIEEYAFSACQNLKTVSMENASVRELCRFAFAYCGSMEKIDLPYSLTTIDEAAFASDYNLYSITIPKNVTAIKYGAFENCFALWDVYNLSPTLNVEKGAESNGYVGCYSKRVNASSAVSPLESVVAENYRFILYENEWYLVSIAKRLSSQELILPQYFTYNGKTISDYILMEYSFSSDYWDKVYIPQSVEKIESHKNCWHNLHIYSSLYYAGSEQEWREVIKNLNESFFENIIIKYETSYE